ncbi:MAG: ABC transporter substrate-binding protein [Deltaproteobacteria bacterium]|nr:MAG: ABC transporter substrate-binding protein [Deltaproteobacteria bacterium]
MTNLLHLLVVLILLCVSKPSVAQERMRIAWAGSTPSNTPIWVADQKGFFKKNGLNAEVIAISASTIVIQALLTGEVDFIIAPSATLVTSRLAGADTVMVSTNLPLFIDHIVSLGDITTVEQLKGKIGGVNRLGTTSDMTLRLALRRLGVDPEKETKIIATGENPQRLAALARNLTQFTLLGEPLVKEAEKMGFRDLFDIGTLKIPYHVNAVVTREKTVRERRPFVAKVVRAFTEALHFIKTNKEETKALIGKNLKTTDPEGLERAYRAYNGAFPEIPYPNAEGVKTLLDDIAPRTPKAATADPKSFVDLSVVQELEASGFIKQLYKR